MLHRIPCPAFAHKECTYLQKILDANIPSYLRMLLHDNRIDTIHDNQNNVALDEVQSKGENRYCTNFLATA